MENSKLIKVSALALVILGLVMIYIGGFYASKVMLPPIITGLGFFIIAWVFIKLSEKL
jgi:hypothetical protein